MSRSTVVFVHGFTSDPSCWDPFYNRLRKDSDLLCRDYRFIRFSYPTKFVELNLTRRIPSIDECGNALGDYLSRESGPDDQLFLVGHSMGGLVIQSFLAQKINAQRGEDLKNIRSVILFATPNRGATILDTARGIFFKFWGKNPQEEQLRVFDKDIAAMSEVITRSVLGAGSVDKVNCPIPFRAFWGMEDNIVPEVSARGSFVEASGLPGDHSGILQCKPVESGGQSDGQSGDPNDDQRYPALKSALLDPIGHPAMYEIDLFEVTLALTPHPPGTSFTVTEDVKPFTIQTDNTAIRTLKISFSDQNRCSQPYEQFYRSDCGKVEVLSFTDPNDAPPEKQSIYYDTATDFYYTFTPDRKGSFSIKLQIYNGFGEGQRTWHNHMKPNAHYKTFKLTLDLTAYRDAGFQISTEPNMFYYPQNIMDHKMCKRRVGEAPLPYLPSPVGTPSDGPWRRDWQIPNIKGGVIDLVWDFKKTAEAAAASATPNPVLPK